MKLTCLFCIELALVASPVWSADILGRNEEPEQALAGRHGARLGEYRRPVPRPVKRPVKTPVKPPIKCPVKPPTKCPTSRPTRSPTNTPTNTPTYTPTYTPTNTPTYTPTAAATTAMPTPPATTAMPTPFCDGLQQYGGHSYKVVADRPYTWYEAYTIMLDSFCCGSPGYLIIVSDADEQSFLLNSLVGPGGIEVWLGMEDLWNEGTFEWVDGTPVTYNNFRDGEPNNGGFNENCGMMTNDGVGGWNDYECFSTLPGFVLEFNCA